MTVRLSTIVVLFTLALICPPKAVGGQERSVYDLEDFDLLRSTAWAIRWYFDRQALERIVPLYAYKPSVLCPVLIKVSSLAMDEVGPSPALPSEKSMDQKARNVIVAKTIADRSKRILKPPKDLLLHKAFKKLGLLAVVRTTPTPAAADFSHARVLELCSSTNYPAGKLVATEHPVPALSADMIQGRYFLELGG